MILTTLHVGAFVCNIISPSFNTIYISCELLGNLATLNVILICISCTSSSEYHTTVNDSPIVIPNLPAGNYTVDVTAVDVNIRTVEVIMVSDDVITTTTNTLSTIATATTTNTLSSIATATTTNTLSTITTATTTNTLSSIATAKTTNTLSTITTATTTNTPTTESTTCKNMRYVCK